MGLIIIVLNILLPPVPLMGTKHNAASLALLQGKPYIIAPARGRLLRKLL